MKRFLLAVLVLAVAAVLGPPVWYAIFPVTPPDLPPAGRRVVLASGVGVNVVEQGSGAPVLLVHGLPGSAYDWRVLAPALAARGFRTLAYDRVGYGYSDARSDGRFTIEQNATELIELLEALALDDATVVGWSYGGGTAIVAAQRRPARLGRIALVGSAGPGIENREPPLAVRVIFSAPVLLWLRFVPPAAIALRQLTSVAAYSGQTMPDWWMPSLNANFGRPHTPLTYRAEGSSFGTQKVPDPTGLELPILIVHGSDDQLAPIAIGNELHRRAPHSRLVVVDGGSHMLPITHAELLADEIAALATSEK
jgi:pimeloyl-ACP methyl ester carboxylesterase